MNQLSALSAARPAAQHALEQRGPLPDSQTMPEDRSRSAGLQLESPPQIMRVMTFARDLRAT